MFILFRSLGHLTEEMLIYEAEIAKSRIKGFVTDGYLDKVACLNQENKTSHCYRLSKEGIDFVKTELKIGLFYKRRKPEIDLPRAEEYFLSRQKKTSESSVRSNMDIEMLLNRIESSFQKIEKEVENRENRVRLREKDLKRREEILLWNEERIEKYLVRYPVVEKPKEGQDDLIGIVADNNFTSTKLKTIISSTNSKEEDII